MNTKSNFLEHSFSIKVLPLQLDYLHRTSLLTYWISKSLRDNSRMQRLQMIIGIVVSGKREHGQSPPDHVTTMVVIGVKYFQCRYQEAATTIQAVVEQPLRHGYSTPHEASDFQTLKSNTLLPPRLPPPSFPNQPPIHHPSTLHNLLTTRISSRRSIHNRSPGSKPPPARTKAARPNHADPTPKSHRDPRSARKSRHTTSPIRELRFE